jgi:predicted transcriptional regulator
MDCIPQTRRRVIERLRELESYWTSTTEIADELDSPTITVRRTCEDLLGLGVIDRQKATKDGMAHSWKLRESTSELLTVAQPNEQEVPF